MVRTRTSAILALALTCWIQALAPVPTSAFSFSSLFGNDDDSADDTSSNKANQDNLNVPARQPLLDAADWFLTEQEMTDSRGGVPRSDMATYSTGNAVTSFAAPNDFFNAAYDDLASTKEGERVLLAAWVVALVPLKPDVDPTVGSANWNRRSMTSDSEVAANVIDGGTVESPDGVTVKKMARDFRIRKFQEMTGLSYDELDAMTFSESADKFEAAAQASDKVSILQHLKVEYHAYYIAITDIIRKVSDPEDTCPSD
ncbi:hypothetical protein PRIC2_001950 [Phytophthora ramorum]